MKLYIFVIGLFLCSIQLNAQTISPETAYKRAEEFLGKELVESKLDKKSISRRCQKKYTEPEYYIFNASDGNGFVIVSGEDKLPSIVGYSYDNAFNVENIHPSLSAFLDSYADYVNDVRCGVANSNLRSNKISSSVKPLCSSKWGQDAPYNSKCPVVDNKTCPVGCVATAMAQIMHHFKWPQKGEGEAIYATGISGWSPLSSNFSEHVYQWDAMKDLTSENKSDELAAEEVAKLSFDCGVATKMSYSPEGSGTHDDLAMYALYTYFGYKASTIHLERRDCFRDQDEWDDYVKSELNANRPVLYGGYSTTGGHEFIVDGYDSNGLFHVNWGWDGKTNGYFALNTFTYSTNSSMVCGIEPDVTGEDKTPHQFRLFLEDAPEVNVDDSIALGESFNVNLGVYYNYSKTAHTWTIATALYDLEGNQLKVLSSKTASKYTQQILSYFLGTVKTIKTTLPSTLKDGFYYIRCVARQQGYDEFILPDMFGGSYLNAIPVCVRNGVAYFGDETVSISPVTNTVSREYYSLSGIKLSPSNNSKGMVIERIINSDGSITSRKVYLK